MCDNAQKFTIGDFFRSLNAQTLNRGRARKPCSEATFAQKKLQHICMVFRYEYYECANASGSYSLALANLAFTNMRGAFQKEHKFEQFFGITLQCIHPPLPPSIRRWIGPNIAPPISNRISRSRPPFKRATSPETVAANAAHFKV